VSQAISASRVVAFLRILLVEMSVKNVQKKDAVAKALQTKREKKTAELKAQAMVDGGEAAVDQTIVGVANKVSSLLVKNPSLCLKVAAMLEEGTLEQMLIGSIEQLPPQPVVRKFRQSCTRFSKLPDYVMEELMTELNPEIAKEWNKEVDGDLRGIVCFALHVLPTTWLPSHYSSECWVIEAFLQAAKQRYITMGERLKTGRPPSLHLWALDYEEAILYFQVGQQRLALKVPSCGCPLPEDAKIEDPSRFDTSFSCKSKFVGFAVTDLLASQPDETIAPYRMHMVEQDTPWEGLLKRKGCAADELEVDADEAEESPLKAASSSASPSQTVAAAPASIPRIARKDSFKSSIFKSLHGSGKATSPTLHSTDA